MDNQIKKDKRPRQRGLGFGVFLLLLGFYFLGVNYNILPSEINEVIFHWPMILIIIGVVKLGRAQFYHGSIISAIGVYFMLPYLFPAINMHLLWPILLIATGVFVILHRLFGHHRREDEWREWHSNWKKEKFGKGDFDFSHARPDFPIDDKNFSKNSVFGSIEHIVLDPEFKGGELNAVFGGIVLDLRRTHLPEGEHTLEVNAVFGGVTIYVPSDWVVQTHFDSVFGGFQDKRLLAENLDHSRKLIICGSVIFGGGEINN